MDRRIAFWVSALFANAAFKYGKGDIIAAYKSQREFATEVAYARQYDKVYAYRNN